MVVSIPTVQVSFRAYVQDGQSTQISDQTIN